MHRPGMLPADPGPNDYEIKRGFVNEAWTRLVVKARFQDLKQAPFDANADPREVAVKILERWVLSNDAQGKISEAGYWHQSVDVEVGLGTVFTYTSP